MEPMYIFGWTVLTSLFGAGIVLGVLKKTVNGSVSRISEIHHRLSKHIDDEGKADSKTHERIARVETKVDMILERIK